MGIMTNLPAREGLAECFDTLRAEGWDVLTCTNGGRKGSEGYFAAAGIEWTKGTNLISCDEISRGNGEGDGKGVAKPDPRVYDAANRVLDERGVDREGERERSTRWFVAAHAWDLTAARNAGFKTAWVAHEEGEACTGLFGNFDVCAESLAECAAMMVALEKKSQGNKGT